jgi:hypothetical protein
MTVAVSTSGDLRLDQTAGNQSGGTPDKDDFTITTALGALPDPFEAFLEGLSPTLSATQLSNAALYGGASEDPGSGFFINVSTDGEPIQDLYFSQSNGTLFNGQVATYTDSGDVQHNLTVAGSTDPIYLYSFAGGDILIGSTEAPAGVDIADPTTLDGGQIVFAYYLEENGTHTGADVYGVVFQPLEHFVDGSTGTALDDTVDLGDFLNVSATGNVSFDFDNLRSGKFLWVALGTESAGLLLTGRDLNVQQGGRKDGLMISGTSDPSDAVNTSQGGIGATTGINTQMYTPGAVGVITFVTGFDPLPTDTSGEAAGDNVKQIDYDGYINVNTAGVFISQTQGNGTVNMTIGIYEADGSSQEGLQPETGFGYIGLEGGNDNTSGAFENDIDNGEIVVTTVVVKSGNTIIGTWDSSNDNTQIGDVKVDLDGNEAHITGLSAGMEVFLSSGSDTFNRLQISADAGTTSFDIGRVDLTQAVAATENIGGSVLIHDDAPTITVDDDLSADFTNGAQGGWDPDPGTDGFQSFSLNFDSYAIDDGDAGTDDAVSVDVSLGTLTTTDANGNYVFTGSITDDFTPNDGIDNEQTVDFTLTFDPGDDSDPNNVIPPTYDLQLDTPPSTITRFDTSQGSLRAGGPDAVQTLEFAGASNDVVFFGVVATAPSSGVANSDNDILDLVSPDRTEAQLQALNAPSLINPSTKMNVSTSGIGINNNNLDGANQGSGTGVFANTTITSADESFVINPEQDVDTVRVFIDNAVGGYNTATEDLYYILYYTDGTVSDPILVEDLVATEHGDPDVPQAAQGGSYFDIPSGDKKIEAVQLTMGTGTVKIPVIEFTIEQEFVPAPLTLDFTAELSDEDGDSSQDSFTIHLTDA